MGSISTQVALVTAIADEDLRRYSFCRSGKVFQQIIFEYWILDLHCERKPRLYVTHHRLGGVDEPHNDEMGDRRSDPGTSARSVFRIKVVSSAF